MRLLGVIFLWLSPLGIFANIVFVHLGGDLPKYAFTTMQQARFFNPDTPIYLLVEGDQGSNPFFRSQQIEVVNLDTIPVTEEHKAFHRVNRIDPKLHGGFWFYATERFFALFDFLSHTGIKRVIHLENDTMLYIDIKQIFPLLEEVSIAAPFQSLVGCIPCFVYIKNKESLADLIHHILEEMKNYKGVRPNLYINDMQTLASYYGKYGSQALLPLPTLMPEYRRYEKRKSKFSLDNATPIAFLSLYSERFSGYLFDAAGLAIYLNGNDRKDSPQSGPGAMHSRVLFNPSLFSYHWGLDEEGRKYLYIIFRGKEYRIINLHFHSKLPESYASF